MENSPEPQTADQVSLEKPYKPKTKFSSWLDKYFSINKNHSSLLKEILGGLVIFLAMFYILPVNSSILSINWTSAGQITSIPLYGDVVASVDEVYTGVFVATAISAGLTSILMGFYGKLPIGLAPAMGINIMIAFTVMLKFGFNFAQAMCLVLVDGILFLIISITPLRAIIVKSIPQCLKIAISAGIGFFIAFVGFLDAGIVVPNSSTSLSFGYLSSPSVLLAIFGIIFVLALSALPQNHKLTFWMSKFGVIIAMILTGLIGATLGTLGVEGLPKFYSDTYSYSSILQFNKIFGCCFKGFDVYTHPEAYAVTIILLFIDFFDTTGTLVGVETGMGMVDKNGLITVDDRPAMITDAIGTCLGAVCGTTTVSSYVESTAGVAVGARTGLAAVVTGLLFLLSLAIYPGLTMFSASATSLALVFVGACMFKNLKELDWSDWIAVCSGFITIIIMIVSYSISDGMAWGFIVYSILKLVSLKFTKKDIPVACISLAFIILYIVQFTTGII